MIFFYLFHFILLLKFGISSRMTGDKQTKQMKKQFSILQPNRDSLSSRRLKSKENKKGKSEWLRLLLLYVV